MLSVAVRDFFAFGVNINEYTQLLFAPSVAPHVVPAAINAKSPGLVPPMLELSPAAIV
jgi:hypothetical protein